MMQKYHHKKHNPQSSREIKNTNSSKQKERNLSSGKGTSPKNRLVLQKKQPVLAGSNIVNNKKNRGHNRSNSSLTKEKPENVTCQFHPSNQLSNQMNNKIMKPVLFRPNCLVKDFSGSGGFNSEQKNNKKSSMTNENSKDLKGAGQNTFDFDEQKGNKSMGKGNDYKSNLLNKNKRSGGFRVKEEDDFEEC